MLYPAQTLKRRCIKQMARTVQCMGLNALWARRVQSLPLSHNFNFAAWLERIRQDLRQDEIDPVVIWPPPARSKARVYVHLLRADATRIAFAKLTFDACNNDRIEREGRVLRKLGDMKSVGFRVPGVLGEGRMKESRYLLMESLPQHAVPLNVSWSFLKERVIAAYAGPPRCLSREELQRVTWWRLFQQNSSPSSNFVRELTQLSFKQCVVCCAHGDLGGHNMVRSGQEIWLFDWEGACDNAPVRADEVRFYLGQHQKEILTDPSAALSIFAEHFRLKDSAQRQQVMQALAFLQSAGIGAAQLLIKHWKNDSSA